MSVTAAVPFSKTRLEALSDGVFAIAMTLLVLELKIPEVPRPVQTHAVLEALRHEALGFLGFFMTFILSAQFWIFQHVLFNYMRHATKAIALLTLAFLMFVSLLPFSTSMLPAAGLRNTVSLLFYVGNQWVLAALLALTWRTARQEGVLNDDTSVERISYAYTIGVLPFALLIPLIAAVVAPARAISALALSQIVGVVVAKVMTRRRA